MMELKLHSKLVVLIVDWLSTQLDLSDAFLFVDDPALEAERPPIIGSSVPDVYVKSLRTNQEFIGEAKTLADLSTDRSHKQIKDYLRYASRRTNTQIVFALESRARVFAEKIIYPEIERSNINKSSIHYLML
jgi:hypothetical protein